MLRDYIINAAILVAFISLIHQIYHPSGFSKDLSAMQRVLFGLIFSVMGVALMIFAVRIEEARIDFRNIAVIIAAFSAGTMPAVISGLLIGISRILLFGLTPASIAGCILILFITALTWVLNSTSFSHWKKWVTAVIFTVIATCIVLKIVILDPSLQLKSMLSFSVSFPLISVILYHYLNYLKTITESYRQCKMEVSRDFLTGLNNVRSFDSLYNAYLESAAAKSEPFSLIYLDIDFFKRVNDTYGHKEGDTVLAKLGEVLVESCRSIDSVSRNGGEEFSVILKDCLPDMALEIGERIRVNVEKTPIKLANGTIIHITVSLGIASYPNPIEDFTMLREKADGALYEAKRRGRNQVAVAQS